MLKADPEIMHKIYLKAFETNTVSSLLENLVHLDHMCGPKACTELKPDLPVSENLWLWYARDGVGSVQLFGGLLCRDGEWSLHG